jgi:hypothetical protein
MTNNGMGAVVISSNPEKLPEVQNSLCSLAQEISNLDLAVKELYERLDPVLSRRNPMIETKGQETITEVCLLVQDIDTKKDAILRISTVVRNILERLQV